MVKISCLKPYNGRAPACGCFCGGCPNFIRDVRPCLGASFTDRCEGCTSYHLCCKEKGINHCYECEKYPCKRFKSFSKRWLKYGQNFIENQELLKSVGEVEFIRIWNSKMDNKDT